MDGASIVFLFIGAIAGIIGGMLFGRGNSRAGNIDNTIRDIERTTSDTKRVLDEQQQSIDKSGQIIDRLKSIIKTAKKRSNSNSSGR